MEVKSALGHVGLMLDMDKQCQRLSKISCVIQSNQFVGSVLFDSVCSTANAYPPVFDKLPKPATNVTES